MQETAHARDSRGADSRRQPWLTCVFLLIIMTMWGRGACVWAQCAFRADFDLPSQHGSSIEYGIVPGEPGEIWATVVWDEDASELSLRLVGPVRRAPGITPPTISPIGPSGLRFQVEPGVRELLSLAGPIEMNTTSRNSGTSPLQLRYEVTEEILQTGDRWLIVIENESGVAIGPATATVEYRASGQTENNTVERRVLVDGTVELRYPNSCVVTSEPEGPTCIQCPGEERRPYFDNSPPVPFLYVPVPDEERIDPLVTEWVRRIGARALDIARNLLLETDDSIDRYLNLETEKNTYECLELRIWLLESLLVP
jgi:hypothetical protein